MAASRDTKPYAFLQKDEVPVTVNPSLWRQAPLNALNGLFKVTERDRCAVSISPTSPSSGNPPKRRELFGLLDEFSPDFEIAEPR